MSALGHLTAKVAAGAHLTDGEIEDLGASGDLLTLGMLADEVRRQRHGNAVTFVRVADVAATDDLPVSPPPQPAGELRIVGTPPGLSRAIARVRAARAVAGYLPLTGFSLGDLEAMAARDGAALESALVWLREAGLDLVAEAPLDQLARLDDAFAAVTESRLPVARLTIDAAGTNEWLGLVRRARRLVSPAVPRAFAPLRRRLNTTTPSTGYADVRQVALARLLVDNIPSIQVDWALYGPKLAQVALTFGADDLDAVSPHDTLDEGRRRAPLEEVCRNIRAAAGEPVERNGRFELVTP